MSPLLGSMTDTLAEMVRRRRKEMRLTQTALAERSGVKQGIISRIETGAYKEIPPPEVLTALSRELHIPVIQMLKAIGFVVDIGARKPDPTDPREQFIARVRRLRWTPGVQTSTDIMLRVLESEQGIKTD